MTRLKSKLLSFNAQKTVPTKIYSPANCEELRIPFKTDKIAKVVGKLASITPPMPRSLTPGGSEAEHDGIKQEQDGDRVDVISGVLIQNDFKISLMAPEDLKEYAGLTTTTILCRQHITLSAAGIDLIRWALEGTFGAIKETRVTDAAVDGKVSGTENGHKEEEEEANEEVNRTEVKFTVMDCVNVLVKNGGRVEVEWEGNVINDGIADAVLAVLFTVESSPAAVRRKYSLSILPVVLTLTNIRIKNLRSNTRTRTFHIKIQTTSPPQSLPTVLRATRTPTAPLIRPHALLASSFSSRRNSAKNPSAPLRYLAIALQQRPQTERRPPLRMPIHPLPTLRQPTARPRQILLASLATLQNPTQRMINCPWKTNKS